MNIIDVSMEISEDMIYYPGGVQPEVEHYRQIPEDSVNASEISISTHTGTHVDAPLHVKQDGESVEELDLENFYGKAQVLDLTGCDENVDREDLEKSAIDRDIVLLKTGNSRKNYKEFREDFTYLTLEAVEYLIKQDVKTVGIDYLSLVKFNGGEDAQEAHLKANEEMTVIEGLDLRDVEPGKYIFSGMPLKMETDGAPMRAALIEK